jgi:hypothetical protein
MKPLKGILDKDFRYVSAAKTDVAATFRRIRREMKQHGMPQPSEPVDLPEPRTVVALMPKNRRA